MNDYEQPSQTQLRITYADQIKPKRQSWLYKLDDVGVMPLGTGTICAGSGGEGKSTFTLYVAALLTRGELPGDLHGQKHVVIVFSPEDDWATVTIPRLIAAGADLSRVAHVQAETVTDLMTRERELRFPLDVDLLREAVAQTGAKMIIIDPAPSLMHGDMNKVQDVRRSYEPLMALAQEAELAVVMINHFGKGAGSVGHKLSGSHAWRDLTRSYLAFATDEETGERIVTQDKNNYGTGRGSWKFALESADVAVEGGITSVGTVRFLGESEVSVGDLINRLPDDGDDEDRNAAQAFILDMLRGHETWEAKAGDVIKAGLAEGFSKDELKNARKRSRQPRIVSAKSDFGGGWVWRIEPEDESEDPEGVTKVSKVSRSQSMTPSTPWDQKVTPSTQTCPLHGGDFLAGCFTCDGLMGHQGQPPESQATTVPDAVPGPGYESGTRDDAGTKQARKQADVPGVPHVPQFPGGTPGGDVAVLMSKDPVPKSTADIRGVMGWDIQRAGRAAQALAAMRAGDRT